MAPTILERGLPICGLRPITMYVSKSMTFPTPEYWIVSPMLNLLKRTTTYPGFKPGTFGVAVSIPNHYTHLGRQSFHVQSIKIKESTL
jgi:hypothetical protein